MPFHVTSTFKFDIKDWQPLSQTAKRAHRKSIATHPEHGERLRGAGAALRLLVELFESLLNQRVATPLHVQVQVDRL